MNIEKFIDINYKWLVDYIIDFGINPKSNWLWWNWTLDYEWWIFI